uniref:Olfactory receptor n=1 Tax=Castor canadensis TaxID=51338 RepID=A0A8C0WJM7_CASCN
MSCIPNASHSPVFLLLGFSKTGVPHSLFFLLFLAIYLATILGNVTLVLLISRDSRLNSPMYFLLRGLSVIDLGLSTVILPQLLVHLASEYPAIPAARCLAQFFFFYAFGVTDTLVIAVMALDRYVAICDPLHYALVMNRQLCVCLLALSWVVSIVHTMLHVGLLLPLRWSVDTEGNVNLPHFFCDHRPLLRASCSDILSNELAIFLEGGSLMLGPCALIILSTLKLGQLSYVCLQLLDASEQSPPVDPTSPWLDFSMAPSFGYTSSLLLRTLRIRICIAAVMYTAITPLANPFVYSLRNKDVKGALHRLLKQGRMGS